MKTCILCGCLGLGLLLWGGHAVEAQPAGKITVTFTNKTNLDVTFFLNGGVGLRTSLRPGQSQSYDMVVDEGVQPTVGIFQSSGARLNYTVADNGRYAFRVRDGKIINSFD